MEYMTADGHVVTDKQLEAESELLERGERPDGWQDAKETASVFPERNLESTNVKLTD